MLISSGVLPAASSYNGSLTVLRLATPWFATAAAPRAAMQTRPLQHPALAPPRCPARNSGRPHSTARRCGSPACTASSARRGARRAVKVDALRGGEQFDADHARPRCRPCAPSRRAACVAMLTWSSWLAEVGMESTLQGAAMVLFSDDQRGGGHLGDHEAGIEAAVLDQERAAARSSSDRPARRCGARTRLPISAIASASVSAANATGSAWKFPPENTSPCSTNSSGLSVTALASIPQRGAQLPHQVEAGAHDLRLAAERIGILHARAIDVRGADGAARDQVAVLARHRDLAGLAAACVDALVERRIAALERIDRHGAGDHGRCQHVLGAEQARQRQRRGHLRAVDQRQTLLGAQPERLQAGDASSPPRPAGCCRRRARGRCRAAPRPDARAARDHRRRRPIPAPGITGYTSWPAAPAVHRSAPR